MATESADDYVKVGETIDISSGDEGTTLSNMGLYVSGRSSGTSVHEGGIKISTDEDYCFEFGTDSAGGSFTVAGGDGAKAAWSEFLDIEGVAKAAAKAAADKVEVKLPTPADYGVLSVTAGDGIEVTGTAQNPVVGLNETSKGSLGKADSALQEITAGTGLKVSAKANNAQQIDFDETVTFIFNCGGASI